MKKLTLKHWAPTKFPNCKRRILLAITEKGGVGKSFTCRVVSDWLKCHPIGLNVCGVDMDNFINEAGLKAVFEDDPKFVRVNWDDDVEKDKTLTRFLNDDSNDVLIVDGRASMARQAIKNWMDDIDLLSVANDIGLGVTFLFPFFDEIASMGDLDRTLDLYGDLADIVIIRNDAKLTNWDNWLDYPFGGKAEKTREKAARMGCREIVLPAFVGNVGKNINNLANIKGVPFSKIDENNIWEFNRIQKYLMRVSWFGLNPVEELLIPDCKFSAKPEDMEHPWEVGRADGTVRTALQTEIESMRLSPDMLRELKKIKLP